MTTLTFQWIQRQPLPQFGPTIQELEPRPGIDGQRFLQVGQRGQRVSLEVRALAADDEAWAALDAAIKGCQGTQCQLTNATFGWTVTVVLHRVSPITIAAMTVGSSTDDTRLWHGVLDVTLSQAPPS